MSLMKIVAGALAAATIAGSAFAADLPSRKGPPVYVPPPPPLWTGLYGGLNVGGAWTSNSHPNDWTPFVDSGTGDLFFFPSLTSRSNSSGGLGGGQIGYNYQFSSFVIGAEADIQGSGMSNSNDGGFVTLFSPVTGNTLIPLFAGDIDARLRWFGTVRGRAGWLAMPTLLIYGTGGFAYGGVQGGGWFQRSNTRTGWTAGGGVEWMFMPNLSAKIEYLYMDLDSGGTTGFTGWQWGTHRHPQVNIVRAGLNYHFNLFGAAPVVASY
jgi:outer membrane immunogenic protein